MAINSQTTPRGPMDTAQGDGVRSDLERDAWPELSPEIIKLLRDAGETRTLRAGDIVFDVDEASYDLVLVETGAIDIVDRADDRAVARVPEGHFVGELGLLMGQRTFFAARAITESRVIVVPPTVLRRLVAEDPELGERIVGAFAARRRLLTSWGEGGLVIVGDEDDALAMRLRSFTSRNSIPYRWVDRADTQAIAALAESCDLPEQGAAVVTGRNDVIANPTTDGLARAIGLDLVADTGTHFDLTIVGAGPSGLAAAVYAASEGLSTLVIEDTAIGGQAGTSSRIENYLGFPKGISGADLAYLGIVQAVKFGARITAPRRATRLIRKSNGYAIELTDGACVHTRSIVLANGVQYRRLKLARLEEFEGRGVYYSATELEARFCRNTEVVVVGGGNSAGQAAMFLSRHAEHVHLVVRGAGLAATMSSYLSTRIAGDPRITLNTHSEVTALYGDDRLEGLTITGSRTDASLELPARALFLMVGAAPNTAWLEGQIGLDSKGFIETRSDGTTTYATSLPGVFAVGDIRAGSVKRVASAVGEGSVVVSSVHGYLANEETPVGREAPIIE